MLNCFGSLVCLAWGYINRSGLREGFFLYQVTGQFRRVFAWPVSWNHWHSHCWTAIILGLRQTFHSSSKYLQKTTPASMSREGGGIVSWILPPLTWDFERSVDKVMVTVLISIMTCAAYQSCWFSICRTISLTVSATLICCRHLISQCQLTTSGQQRHFLPTLPNRSVQDIKYACIYIQEEGEKWYKHFLHCRNTKISFQLSWDWLADKVLLRKCLRSWSLGTLNIDFLLMRPQI